MYINLKRVEFVITYHCSGKCKHCSVGDKLNEVSHLEYEKLKGLLLNISQQYPLQSIMCFGGEPLLYRGEVEHIMKEAKSGGIPKRQLITNGYFSKNLTVIRETAFNLCNSNITDLLLSVDSFHQEFIPVEPVYEFARSLKEFGITNLKLHPAWVVGKEHDNEWNNRTKELLGQFKDLNIPVSDGNIIFPSGNAAKYLSEYYPKQDMDLNFTCGKAKYTEALDKVETISIMPDGDVNLCCFTIGNVYKEDILEILDRYDPHQSPYINALLENGVKGLVDYTERKGIQLDLQKFHSPCGVCREAVEKLTQLQKTIF